ncbi:MAG: PAS domain S-box protein [Candidatus Hydrogenedentes bacterium]|nr:PAS domain S-box protein [Candidatus Hydrogenedentota bacterium]
MRKQAYSKRRFGLYFIPVLLGMGGILFSKQFDDIATRTIVIIISVSIPFFSGGNLLARFNTNRFERLFLLGGVALLLVGAAVSVAFEGSIWQDVSPSTRTYAHGLGIFSLFLGMFVVLYSVIRTGEDIEEFGERFLHLADHISEGFVLSDATGTIVLVNKQFLEMFGREENEVVGQNTLTLARDLHIEGIPEHFLQRARGLASEYEVNWRVRGEERRFWFSGSPLMARNGRYTGTMATVRDITEQYRLAQKVERYAQGLQQLVEEQTQKLLVSEERFRQLLVSMNEGFVTVDAAYRIRFANERISDMLERSQESLVHEDVFNLVTGSSRVRLLNLLSSEHEWPSKERRQELEFVRKDGSVVHVVAAVAYIREGQDEDAVYSLVITSVAELKIMQAQLEGRALELERMNEELRVHDRAKDSFLSNVTHELRTPLSTIQGYVEMLHTGELGELHGPQRSAIQVMRRNINRLSVLINEMLEFSRMEIRGVTLTRNLFSPLRLVEEAVASIQPAALSRDISVNVFSSESLLPVWADRPKIIQVMGILLSNAVKFTGGGGLITVGAEEGEDNSITLSVSDTGIGIDGKDQEKVFHKFYQVDSSMTRRYEGAGIGLSIAKSIVEAHNGSIRIESVPGQGATFYVTLPDCVFSHHIDPAEVAPLEGRSILVVDKGRAFSEVLHASLAPVSCTFHKSPGGYPAVRAASELHPDLILIHETDLDIAGAVSLQLLREQSPLAGIPIVLVTDQTPAQLQSLQQQFDGLFGLKKPFGAERLVKCMQAALEGGLGDASGIDAEGAQPVGAVAMRNVLALDPDPGMLEWLQMALERRNVGCFCVNSVERARSVMRREALDAVLIDVDSSAEPMETLIASLRAGMPGDKTLILLMTGRIIAPKPIEEVDGVLHKPFEVEELMRYLSTPGVKGESRLHKAV